MNKGPVHFCHFWNGDFLAKYGVWDPFQTHQKYKRQGNVKNYDYGLLKKNLYYCHLGAYFLFFKFCDWEHWKIRFFGYYGKTWNMPSNWKMQVFFQEPIIIVFQFPLAFIFLVDLNWVLSFLYSWKTRRSKISGTETMNWSFHLTHPRTKNVVEFYN